MEIEIIDTIKTTSHIELDVLPCPFCGCEKGLRIKFNENKEGQVICSPCGALGPLNYSPREAVTFWNKRASNQCNT